MDETGEVDRRAKQTVRSIYAEAASEPDSAQRHAIADHGKRSEHVNRIAAMIRLAETEPGIPLSSGDLDRDPWALNMSNGTLDLRTGELRPHRRADLISRSISIEYIAAAQAPRWGAFLEKVLPDPDVRSFVQRAVGYALTGSTREQVLFMPWGSGANGKSTFLETLRLVLGDYAAHTPADTLMARRETGVPNDVARLRGARFITCIETEAGRQLAEARVKQLTGGDKISARYMRGEWFDFEVVGKLWLATNHRPMIRGTDDAIWRRIMLIPFKVKIPPAERDGELREKLRGELPGILAWAIEGCRLWLQHGLQPPPSVEAATSEYREGEDQIGDFLADCCIAGAGKISAERVFGAYRDWCAAMGEEPVSQRSLGERLSELGFPRQRIGSGRRWHRLGLELRPDLKLDP
jgi:putative DNA primase/helicase